MNITNQRRCLNALTAAMIAGACGGGYWAVSKIDSPETTVDRRPAKKMQSVEDDASQYVSTSEMAMRSLRGPLYDPPPMAQRPTPPPQPPPQSPPRVEPKARLDVRLVGTIINDDRSVAIVSDASGKLDVKSRGETLELSPAGIVIDTIDSQTVTLSYQGRQSTIELDRTGTTGGNVNPMAPPENPYGSSRANRRRNQ